MEVYVFYKRVLFKFYKLNCIYFNLMLMLSRLKNVFLFYLKKMKFMYSSELSYSKTLLYNTI